MEGMFYSPFGLPLYLMPVAGIGGRRKGMIEWRMSQVKSVWTAVRAHFCMSVEMGMVFLSMVGLLHMVDSLYWWGVGPSVLLLLEMGAVMLFLSYGFVVVRRYWDRL